MFRQGCRFLRVGAVTKHQAKKALSLWYRRCHEALAMMRMLMRKTMTKKIHMKNLSITLATFFHSATLTDVAFCSRKQFAMNWMFLTT